ncbi:hypothetical protein BDA99DRAFT_561488 [Phascolomyces articulosus]|uniref:Uncharacterized protein n=1 Tax=Phascolomyces articulosus TaxID=60185 RepID=A0AAD5K670_9FUNG|nr:hypothetical protein BDA99DRAFT_561488 [Phascolomyces articulosus]
MLSGRMVNVLLAVGIGVGTGVYVFQPLLKEYQAETQGTWMRPGDEQRIKSWHDKSSSTSTSSSHQE